MVSFRQRGLRPDSPVYLVFPFLTSVPVSSLAYVKRKSFGPPRYLPFGLPKRILVELSSDKSVSPDRTLTYPRKSPRAPLDAPWIGAEGEMARRARPQRCCSRRTRSRPRVGSSCAFQAWPPSRMDRHLRKYAIRCRAPGSRAHHPARRRPACGAVRRRRAGPCRDPRADLAPPPAPGTLYPTYMNRRTFLSLSAAGALTRTAFAAPAPVNKRERMLGWLAGQGAPNYTPAAFFLHFGDPYKTVPRPPNATWSFSATPTWISSKSSSSKPTRNRSSCEIGRTGRS